MITAEKSERMISMTYEEKKEKLNQIIKECKNPVVAYSGGVDSSLLAELAFRFHPDTVQVFSIITPYIDEADIFFGAAAVVGRKQTVIWINLNLLGFPEISANGKDRCYYCKKQMLSTIKGRGEEHNGKSFLEGSNADDKKEYRPGYKAVKELDYRSPLAESGFTKQEIRRYATELGLEAAYAPSKPCLLTRFPYDKNGGVTLEDIERIKAGEHHLKAYLKDNFRLRWLEKDKAAIEASLFDQRVLKIGGAKIYKGIPFTSVTLEKEPFQSGRFDRERKDPS